MNIYPLYVYVYMNIYVYVHIHFYHIYHYYVYIHGTGLELWVMFHRYFLIVRGLREVWSATTLTTLNCLRLENGAGDPSFRYSQR